MPHAGPETQRFSPALGAYIAQREREGDQIDDARRQPLGEIARYVRTRLEGGGPARLIFVCTHNSRRSHLGHVWAQTAAAWRGIPGVRAYSGGTEATRFNHSAVAALERAGFVARRLSDDENPVHLLAWGADATPIPCFSKVFSGAPNPRAGFGAVMVCTDADEACPIVAGADARFSLPYLDPKARDGTPGEPNAYDDRCRQIAREMLYVFTLVGAG